MKLKQPSIRALGQRSIPSTFIFRSTNKSTDSGKKEDIKTTNETVGSRVSLSEFLNRKLHRSSLLPGSLQGKEKPFSSPFGGGLVSGCEKEQEVALDIVLQEFEKEHNDVCPSADIERSGDHTNDTEEVKKRTRGDATESSRKIVAVLGGDSEPNKRRRKRKIEGSNEKPLPVYNHYANGKGWWDDEMEGVDNEEVGSTTEVWEGLGSTTLGGIDWH